MLSRRFIFLIFGIIVHVSVVKAATTAAVETTTAAAETTTAAAETTTAAAETTTAAAETTTAAAETTTAAAETTTAAAETTTAAAETTTAATETTTAAAETTTAAAETTTAAAETTTAAAETTTAAAETTTAAAETTTAAAETTTAAAETTTAAAETTTITPTPTIPPELAAVGLGVTTTGPVTTADADRFLQFLETYVRTVLATSCDTCCGNPNSQFDIMSSYISQGSNMYLYVFEVECAATQGAGRRRKKRQAPGTQTSIIQAVFAAIQQNPTGLPFLLNLCCADTTNGLMGFCCRTTYDEVIAIPTDDPRLTAGTTGSGTTGSVTTDMDTQPTTSQPTTSPVTSGGTSVFITFQGPNVRGNVDSAAPAVTMAIQSAVNDYCSVNPTQCCQDASNTNAAMTVDNGITLEFVNQDATMGSYRVEASVMCTSGPSAVPQEVLQNILSDSASIAGINAALPNGLTVSNVGVSMPTFESSNMAAIVWGIVGALMGIVLITVIAFSLVRCAMNIRRLSPYGQQAPVFGRRRPVGPFGNGLVFVRPGQRFVPEPGFRPSF